jgi:xanthine dehydrogenase small subunit
MTPPPPAADLPRRASKAERARDHLLVAVNGRLHEVSGDDVFLPLSTWLRERLRLVGTKIVCSEGDCGACTVLVGTPAPDGGRFAYRSLDACIAFLYQLDRRHVITVDGLAPAGAPLEALHPAQRAMAEKFGSQCGFCTPGIVMALCELDDAARRTGRRPTDAELRIGLSGNLCRCTGYVQILDAARALDGGGPALGELHDDAALLAAFATSAGAVRLAQEGRALELPATWPEAVAARARDPEATVVAGATDVGVQVKKGTRTPRRVLHLRSELPGFGEAAVADGALQVGAGARWADLLELARDAAPELAAIVERFGAPQIRNAGTLGGNLVNASPIADSLPFLYVAEASLRLDSTRGSRRLPIADFYRGYKQLDLAPDELLAAVEIPLPGPAVRLRLLKASRRRDLDISTFTAALCLEIDQGRIAEARLALGGVGPTVVRLPAAERSLRGSTISVDAFRAAGELAASEIRPISDVRGRAAYRRLLARNALVRFAHELGAEESAA